MSSFCDLLSANSSLYTQTFYHCDHQSWQQEELSLLQQSVRALPLCRQIQQENGTDPDLDRWEALAKELKERFTDILILGTGGSNLGGKALASLGSGEYGHESPCLRLHFYDNIDSHTFERQLAQLIPEKTAVIAISKSGSTPETLMQLRYALSHWVSRWPTGQEVPVADHFLMITEPTDNPLRALGVFYGCRILDHPLDIGGRFSVLTVVGLLPALLAGVEARAVRRGARHVLESFLQSTDPLHVPAWVAAGIQHSLWQQGIHQSVIMPYVDRLVPFSLWYRQLWAESLGKEGKGTTPIQALGTVDQHSQLQLYLEGPRDKFFTVIGLEHNGASSSPSSFSARPFPSVSNHQNLFDLLSQNTMADLMDAERQATVESLAHQGLPVRMITLKSLCPETMGALMMHWILETLAMASHFSINPFDQPAVEQIKQRTRQWLQNK